MFLIKLDSTTLAVLEVHASITSMPLLVPLSGDYMIAANSPQLGQVFDPATNTFGAPPRKRWLTRLAFDSRFTMAESVALKQAQVLPTRNSGESDADYNARCNIPLQLQVMSERRNLATYIDLDRTDTQQLVQSLETMGLLAAGRAAVILGDPILAHEYHPDA